MIKIKNRVYKIETHWDSEGLITANCDPYVQFSIWEQSANWNPEDWTGKEFTEKDFVDYINKLKGSK
jgi:hypothetical protein